MNRSSERSSRQTPCPITPGRWGNRTAVRDTRLEVGKTLPHPPTTSGGVSRFYGRDFEPGSRFSRSTMERSVLERPMNSIPIRTTPSGPAFAFRTSPVRVTSMEAPTGSRTETRHPTRLDGWRRSKPRPKFEKSNTPQSRHRSEGSPSTWQEPIQTTDWRCALRRFRSGSGSLIGQIYWPPVPARRVGGTLRHPSGAASRCALAGRLSDQRDQSQDPIFMGSVLSSLRTKR